MARNTAAVLAEELLDAARAATGCARLAYAEPPVRLGGGFFTENYAFRLADAPPPWHGPLVVRLFPNEAPDDLAHREEAVQRVLASQGYPAPPIVWFDADARLDRRCCFVMRKLPGCPLVGGVKFGELLTSLPKLQRQLVDVTASAQAWLHCLDAAPFIAELADAPLGVERWFQRLADFDDLAPAREWLVSNRPMETMRPVICHGDLWAGNILVDGDELSGVLDYTVVTVAEPALDVGFVAMSFDLVPVGLPGPLQRLAVRIARGFRRRYVDAYVTATGADLANVRYYEALRCASELTNVIAYRLATARGVRRDAPRPTWDAVSDQMVAYFRERTGVTLRLPPPVGRDRSRGR
jgi:aminoglycoside phosphotransferase (APT) family kinase protein